VTPRPEDMVATYAPNIGLEVHAELSTRTKVFCGCSTAAGGPPNSQVCPVCLGFPGVLPVLNRSVVEYALRAALAMHCAISRPSIFERKGYYYPDLPKNFQISQKRAPLGKHGCLEIPANGAAKRVRIADVHIEEDAAKLLHPEDDPQHSLVDFNRSGIPLLEIVSEPDMTSVAEVEAYMASIRSMLRYLGISEARMEQGQLRFEASVSVRQEGAAELGTRVEIKNLNSFRAVTGAVDYEIGRQTRALEQGERIVQETRLWDDARGVTEPMRTKETAMDYRYFPEPDLTPLEVDDAWIARVKAELPEMAEARKRRLVEQYTLTDYDAQILTGEKALADLLEQAVAAGAPAKATANWITGRFLYIVNEKGLDPAGVALRPGQLAELVGMVEGGTLTGPAARQVLDRIVESGESPKAVVAELGLSQIRDAAGIASVVDEVVRENPDAVENFRKGKEAALKFLVGQVMRKSKGRANPQMATELLRARLAGQ
jgi:aspartyl-tRNA(Asn)/glutamyl-tRNA(Gln) amidotransferase subunit B